MMEALCVKQLVLAEKLKESIKKGKKTNLERRTYGFYQNKISELKKIWEQFDDSDTKLRELVLSSKTEFTHEYFTSDKYDEVETRYNDYLVELTDGLIEKSPRNLVESTAHEASTIIHTNSTQTQLPRINLPKFDGEYASWRSFHNLFVSLIHNNQQLSEVQKLYHLKGCLKGEAERLLRHVPITGQDYVPAWEKLKQRYENRRLLVNTQLKTLTNQPKLTTESSKTIKTFIDTTEECIQQLKTLNIDVTAWSTILVYLLVQKLPYTTFKLWEEELGDTQQLPEFEHFQKFLTTRFRILESMSHSVNVKPQVQSTKTYYVSNPNKCPACDGSHYVGVCKRFLKLDTSSRRKCIESSRRCFNCFSNKHTASKCPSNKRCKVCEGSHHHLLHLSSPNTNQSGRSAEQQRENPQLRKPIEITYQETNPAKENEEVKSFFSNETHKALLATAMVKVKDRNNKVVLLRCLVDPGSQTSFVTESAARRLNLKEEYTKIKITGLNRSQMAWSTKQVRAELVSCRNDQTRLQVNMLIINKIADTLPGVQLNTKQWDHLRNLELADPAYWKPGPVDILLGAKVYARILLEGIRRGPATAPIAVNTTLGWLVLGDSPEPSVHTVKAFTAISRLEENLNEQMKKFWEIEECDIKSTLTLEERECEENFKTNHCRLKNVSEHCLESDVSLFSV